MKLPPEMLAVIERETALARIRRSLADLNSSEAAPRLNAQVRLREEHVEMLQLLLDEIDRQTEKGHAALDSLWELRGANLELQRALEADDTKICKKRRKCW